MMLTTLIMGLMAGPAVSLFGSPTVSPVTAALSFLDVLLRVVPRRAAARHLNRQEQPGHDRAEEHSAEGAWAEEKTDRDRRHDRDDAGDDHLPLRSGGHDPDRGAVLGPARALEDALDLAELAPHLFDHETAGSPDGEHRQRAEEERQDAAQEQA